MVLDRPALPLAVGRPVAVRSGTDHAEWPADAGFVTAAPDLFSGRTVARCPRRTVRDYASWEGETFAQVETVRSWLAAREDCTGRVGVIGVCLGGGLALSLAPGHGLVVSGANYGQLPKDAERYLVGACPVLGSYGVRDRSLPHAADRLRRALEVAGVDNDVKEYPDAGHGFPNDHRSGEVPVMFRCWAWWCATASTGRARLMPGAGSSSSSTDTWTHRARHDG